MRVFKLSYIFLCFIVFVSVTSCGGTSEKEETEDPSTFNLDDDYYEFKGVSLKDYGIPTMIMLPDETANIGAATKPEILHIEGDFIWDINLGNNFSLHIEDYGDFNDLVDYKKKELKEQEIFKVKYLVNEKDMIIYERTLIVKGTKNASPKVGVEHKSFHVYAQKTINGITYEFRSRDEGYDHSQKRIINLMAKSIKSIEELK